MSVQSAERPPTEPAAAQLRRWLSAWMALLLLTQVATSVWAGVHGTWHRHWRELQAAATLPDPGDVHDAHEPDDHHEQMHARGEAHSHAATDASVLASGPDAAGDAMAQLASVLAPGTEAAWRAHGRAHHVQAGAAPWAATSRTIAPPAKPPRA